MNDFFINVYRFSNYIFRKGVRICGYRKYIEYLGMIFR